MKIKIKFMQIIKQILNKIKSIYSFFFTNLYIKNHYPLYQSYALNRAFISFIIPKLEVLRNYYSKDTFGKNKEMAKKIDIMIDGFFYYDQALLGNKKAKEKINEALEIFRETFWNLWY